MDLSDEEMLWDAVDVGTPTDSHRLLGKLGRDASRSRASTAVASDSSAPRFPYLTGFEGARFAHSDTDVLETSEHLTRYRHDLDRLQQDGIDSFRCCIPWHRIERTPGVYDWEWLDGYLSCVREHGLEPIADPLHHASFPTFLTGGFADPQFPEKYCAFVKALARRYPWIHRYTPANEPVLTSWFCGGEGIWPPYGNTHDSFIAMIRGVAKAICLTSNMLIETLPTVEIVHTERCGRNYAFDRESIQHAERLNEEQFLVLDLIQGRVDRHHPLHRYIARHGMTDDDLAWFRDHRTRVDVLGTDYYTFSSEMAWNRDGQVLRHPVAGYAEIASEYVRRYDLPIMLSETNVPGFTSDRITVLKYMAEECEKLARMPHVSFRGFCWYPYIDSTGWKNRLEHVSQEVDPQGIYWLGQDCARNASELSELYGRLARHEITAEDLPAYRLDDATMKAWRVYNYLPHTAHWRWQKPSA